MSMRSKLPAIAIASVAIGCGSTTRSVFHLTDQTFRPAPGSAPAVYLVVDDVPRSRMRSVGTIVVTVAQSSGIQRAIEVAKEKGRQLGCWILIEESIFATARTRASLDHGAAVQLAHGGGDHGGQDRGGSESSDGKLTAEFHCVLQDAGTSASAGMLSL